MLNIKQDDNTLYTHLHRFYEVVLETVFNWGQQTVMSVQHCIVLKLTLISLLHGPSTVSLVMMLLIILL